MLQICYSGVTYKKTHPEPYRVGFPLAFFYFSFLEVPLYPRNKETYSVGVSERFLASTDLNVRS